MQAAEERRLGTLNGSWVMVQMPTIRTITVDMSRLAGITTARWYDSANGDLYQVPVIRTHMPNGALR